ncbi:hypothetical protein [Bacillus sp. Hm123]|uniref:hypothetical protein n=1 Tax=Bacillus sp. Hm123 TaxID=3450745 RepID=UPI003F438C46
MRSEIQVNPVAYETEQISVNIQTVNEQSDFTIEKANQGQNFAHNVTEQMDIILTKIFSAMLFSFYPFQKLIYPVLTDYKTLLSQISLYSLIIRIKSYW